MAGEPTTELQERALARMIARGNLAARDRLAMAHVRLADAEARRFHGALGREDAVGVATLALVAAASGYRGKVRFAFFARTAIRLELRRAARLAIASRKRERSLERHPEPAAPPDDGLDGVQRAVRAAVDESLTERERGDVERFLAAGGSLGERVADKLRRHLSR